MAIMVSGGMLTEGSIERIREFVDTQIKGDSNYSKFLIIEGEGSHDALSGTSNVKVEVEIFDQAINNWLPCHARGKVKHYSF